MAKKLFCFLMASLMVSCVLLLCSCSDSNRLGLSFASDGGDEVDYIYQDDIRVIYVVGGIMMAELDGSAVMLEVALNDGDITVDDILTSAQEDADAEDIELTEYIDGSKEYHYEDFDLVVLNTAKSVDIYFLPKDMSYYDIAN